MKTLLGISLIIYCLQATAQPADSSILHLRFRDDVTGVSVIPSSLSFIARQHNIAPLLFIKNAVSQKTLTLPDATWDISVSAIGYKPMTTWLDLHQQTVNLTFQLVPEVPNHKAASGYIKSQCRTDYMFVSGYITDKVTGSPLAGVAINTGGREKKNTQSDSTGYYSLHIPLAHNDADALTGNQIIFSKAGYRDCIITRFDMWSAGDMWSKVTLNMGNGSDTTYVLQRREPVLELK